jgi:hypothetical protein
VTLDDWLPYVLPRATGCPESVALQHIRKAIIELCRESMIWRETQDTIDASIDETEYEYEQDSGQQVLQLLSVKVGGWPVDLIAADKGRALLDQQSGQRFAFGTFTGFVVNPAQADGVELVTYSVVAPSITATRVPDSFGRYLDGIADGALSTILTAKDKSYSDPAGAIVAKTAWELCKTSAAADALRGFARAPGRTAKVWF